MKKLHAYLLSMITGLFCLALAAPAGAQTLTVDIHGPGQKLVNMTMLPPRILPDGGETPVAKALREHIVNDLSFLPFLRPVGANTLLGGDPSTGIKGSEIDMKPLQLAKVDLVMTTGWFGDDVELRVFETYTGRMVVGKAYSQVSRSTPAKVADRFCSVFLETLTGKKGFFESPIAFVRQNGENKEIFTTLPQGRELTQITRLGGYNLSPDWSPDGNQVVFSHIGAKTHKLGVYDRATRKVTLYTKGLGQTVISPAFDPQGRVVVGLNKNGESNIFRLGPDFRPQTGLVISPYIDVSPSFDRSGRHMAFTSGRAGNPHIYVMDMDSGAITRVTIDGTYNTHPCLSPNGRYIAYTRRTSEGHRIFVHDLETHREKQLTFGPGSDEYPAFGPDGYFVAFASNRSGKYQIYLTTRHGDGAKLIPTGEGQAFAPAWDTKTVR